MGGGEGGYGKTEHTGGVEVLAAHEQVNIHWIREVKWNDAHSGRGNVLNQLVVGR